MTEQNRKHLVEINNQFGMTFNPNLFLNESKRILKKFNIYAFTSKSLLKNYITFAEQNNFKWDILIWHKTNAIAINNGHYLIDKEYCIYIKESGAYFDSSLGYYKYQTVKQTGTSKSFTKTKHPAEKPKSIISNWIAISSKQNDTILDPFLGSGTTALAAKQLERKFIGIEISKEYIEIAQQRLRQEILL